jgi:diguanylate cyclase (GGDEF)-like protein
LPDPAGESAKTPPLPPSDGPLPGRIGTPPPHRHLPLDRWLTAVDDPSIGHRYALRLTYGITPAVVAISILARVLGMHIPVGVATLIGTTMLVATWLQEQMVRRGHYRSWMPVVHMNVALTLLTIWVGFSGGVHSPFIWIFALVCAMYGMLQGLRWALITATLSCLYLLAGAELAVGWGLYLRDAGGDPVPARSFLASYAAMFYLAAVVSALGRQQLREISRLAYTDGLTGLGNRRALKQALERDLARSARMGRPVGVLLIELDGFKEVNDRLGHLQGDEILRRVGVALRVTCRGTDSLIRFGGDEFVVVLPDSRTDEAMIAAERIRIAITAIDLPDRIPLTASIGLSTYPDDALTAPELLDAADRAMYQVKARGGNRIGLAS